MSSNNHHEIPLKSTVIANDSRETIVAKYLNASYQEMYYASDDGEGLTSIFRNELRQVVEVFIREKQSQYNGKLTLHKLIKYPSYSKNWDDLVKAILAIQIRRLNIEIKYDAEKMIHVARIYEVIGKDKSPLLALFNALLQWIHNNTTTMGMFEDIDYIQELEK